MLKMSKVTLVGTLGLLVIAIVLGYNIYSSAMSSNSSFTDTSSNSRTLESNAFKTPLPTVYVSFKKNQGKVVSLDSQNLVLDLGGSKQTYSIANTRDFQRILSGTFETGGRFANATREDVKVGQEVLLIVPENSTNVTTVFIIR